MVKELVKKSLVKSAGEKYQKELKSKTLSFDEWIREKESSLERFDMTIDLASAELSDKNASNMSFTAKFGSTTISIIPYSKVNSDFKITNYIEDILVFVNGEVTDKAFPLLAKKFNDSPEVNIVYGDEDIADVDLKKEGKYGKSIEGSRREPFFKPDWSPNTFLDHFYFCNIVAIRRSAFREYNIATGLEGALAIYDSLLRYVFANETNLEKSVAHIDEILVHATDYENNYIKDERALEYASKMHVFEKSDAKISVLIPSKDNPDLLNIVLGSLKTNTEPNLIHEIIVIDNGSNESNQEKIKELSKQYDFKYIYKSMPFNFSKMVNLGAKEATGNIFLLLNDDLTFANNNAIAKMTDVTLLNFSGLVGIKLLYPDSDLIQHAGVINNRIGPVHKLQFQRDIENHYFGFNKSTVNVSAVTAACVMIRKEVFEKVKGLNEDLAVAFNDIDLSFKVMEEGFMNVVCNDVYAIHAESVTRGKDTDEKSIIRLNSEKDKLYAYHPAFKGYDPLYSKYLINDCLDVRICPASEYEYERAAEDVKSISRIKDGVSGFREEPCVQLSLEYVGEMNKFSYKEKDEGYYWLQGFSYVQGSDNACYKKYILLNCGNETYKIKIKGAVRSDVSEFAKDQVNVGLSGFAVKIPKGLLKPGEYKVGFLFVNKFAREKLYNFSNKYLVVK